MNHEQIAAAKAARRIQVMGIVSGGLIALYGLFISREHITDVGNWMHLKPSEAATLFVFIDFVAIFGKIMTSKRLSAKTRRIGYKILIVGGSLSLACNVGAGFIGPLNIGESFYGAFIVGIIAMLEYAIANTKPKAIVKGRTKRQPAATAAPAAPSTGKTWSPARRAAHEARKAATTWAPSAESLEAEFADELTAK